MTPEPLFTLAMCVTVRKSINANVAQPVRIHIHSHTKFSPLEHNGHRGLVRPYLHSDCINAAPLRCFSIGGGGGGGCYSTCWLELNKDCSKNSLKTQWFTILTALLHQRKVIYLDDDPN